jgi:hypothetical protein
VTDSPTTPSKKGARASARQLVYLSSLIGSEDLTLPLSAEVKAAINERLRIGSLGAEVSSLLSSDVGQLVAMQEVISKQVLGVMGPTLETQQAWLANMAPQIFPIVGLDLGWVTEFARVFEPLRVPLFEQFQTLFDSLVEIPNLGRGIFPDNLIEADSDFDIETCKALMMDEGLPIAWVPRASTMSAVFAGTTRSERRAVYGRRWKSVVEDCVELLKQTTSPEIVELVAFAKKSAEALRQGHHEAALALSANTLDTVLKSYLSTAMRPEVTGKKRLEPDGYSARQFFVYSQLWGIHRPFYGNQSESPPSTFNRHGTVHGVSKRQYSRLNAVLGLAHLTSLLWWVDTGFANRPS